MWSISDSDARWLGIDIGSVSLNAAVVDAGGNVLQGIYRRTEGQPLLHLADALRELLPRTPEAAICGTGSGRPLLTDLLGLRAENEIVAHAWAAVRCHTEARTVIEIGGQDSKLILLDGSDECGSPRIVDQAMNEICAAGTGSFLDQQAARLGVEIDGEFGQLALASEHPAAIAGRCSVFAKSDMIHLQQEGYPQEDIIAGLCYALARNYLSNLARGRKLGPPILFQGGVAANKGVVRAFEDLLELGPGGLIIPEDFRLMGAIGAALIAKADDIEPTSLLELLRRLEAHLAQRHDTPSTLPRLRAPRASGGPLPRSTAFGSQAPHNTVAGACAQARGEQDRICLGIDVGSVSANIVLIDEAGRVRDELYLYTEGAPIETVRSGLLRLGQALGQPPEIAAVGVTGSGRHLVGNMVGADLVVNEITAQARAAAAIDPQVDTVFEIGGQDSKFIRLRDGAVIDFEMNKVCAAGTGAFLAEQAARLRIDVHEDFSRLALQAPAPVDLGSRCTVFMESDLIHHQQHGATKDGLVAGLAYAVARNYLEKVVGHKPLGQRILFQGGVASNASVAGAFESLLGRPITVPPHNRCTGAIGAALLAREARAEGHSTAFRGFELPALTVHTESFQCQRCPNRCDIKKVALDGQTTSYHGSICGRYDTRSAEPTGPDLFAMREELLLDGWLPEGPGNDAPEIGVPRVLLFHELFPEWRAFFQALGYRIVLSDPTNRHSINEGLRHLVVETCFPIKVVHGHISDLIGKGVERIFLPAVAEVPTADDHRKNYVCPYVQTIPAFIRAAFPDVELLSPVITAAGRRSNWRKAMTSLGRKLGHSRAAIDRALSAACEARQRFDERRTAMGRRILDELPPDKTTVVLLGRPYNTCDPVLSMQVARKLRQRGALPIPYDLLPLREADRDTDTDDVVWKTARDLLAAASLIREHPQLHPLFITSFGCGPDAFVLSMLEEEFAGQPFLALELDEHFGDAGLATRCEAFLHECRDRQRLARDPEPQPKRVHLQPLRRPARDRVVYLPNASEHYLALQAAFRSVGIQAELLPPPDRRTEELGRQATLSRGCIPLIFFAGDALRMREMPGFDPARATFFCAANDEPCKVSQFPRALRRILDREGLGQVELLAPRTSMEAADAFHVLGPTFERNFWRGLVAIDFLGHKALETRPYELEPGQSDAVHRRCAERVAAAVGTRGFLDAVVAALDALDAVPVDRSSPRPVIGVSGEHYVQTCAYANNALVRQIEELGGQVWMTPYFTDYLRVHAWKYPKLRLRRGDYLGAAVAFIRGVVQRRDYARLERLFDGRIANAPEPGIEQIFELAAPYIDREMEVPITTQVAKVVDYIHKGADGIVHVLPLGCMMSTAAAAQFPRILSDHAHVPILTLIYDCLKDTNQRTRLQAFMRSVTGRAELGRRPSRPSSPPLVAEQIASRSPPLPLQA